MRRKRKIWKPLAYTRTLIVITLSPADWTRLPYWSRVRTVNLAGHPHRTSAVDSDSSHESGSTTGSGWSHLASLQPAECGVHATNSRRKRFSFPSTLRTTNKTHNNEMKPIFFFPPYRFPIKIRTRNSTPISCCARRVVFLPVFRNCSSDGIRRLFTRYRWFISFCRKLVTKDSDEIIDFDCVKTYLWKRSCPTIRVEIPVHAAPSGCFFKRIQRV